MQLTRIVLHARLKGGELLHPASGTADFWARAALSLYCLQTLLSTVMSVFGKLAAQDGIGFFELTFFRNAATLVLTIPMLVAGHVNPLAHKIDKAFWLLTLRGLLGFASLATWYLSLALLPLSDALAISFVSPILVAGLAPLVLKEPSPPGLSWTLPLSCVGMLLIAQPSWLFGSITSAEVPSALAVTVGLVQALLSTGSKLVMRALSDYHEPLSEIMYHVALVSCIGSLIGIVAIPGAMTVPRTSQTWGWLLGLCLLGYFTQVCFTAAMQYVPAAKASVMDYASLIWTLIADALVFNHFPSPLSLVGAIIIMASSCTSLLLGQRAEAARAAAEAEAGGGKPAPAPQLTAAEARTLALRKIMRYDSLRNPRKMELAMGLLDGAAEADRETQGLLAEVEGSLPSWTAPRSPCGAPAAAAPSGTAATAAQAATNNGRTQAAAGVAAAAAAVQEDQEEWKLQAATSLAEIVEVGRPDSFSSGAKLQQGVRRTSSEKEAALRAAGR